MSASLEPPIRWSADAIVIANEVAAPPWSFKARTIRADGAVRFRFTRVAFNGAHLVIANLHIDQDIPLPELKNRLQTSLDEIDERERKESPAS